MALPLDFSKPFLFPGELRQLVDWVLQAGAADEARWIEWKSRLDLTTTEGQQHLVRQILGFANRDPDVAARWAGGYAYVIVGAEPGVSRPAGVDLVDAATLEPQLAKWLPEEITWNMNYVRVDNADILVIAVDPPAWGDPIHTLRKAIGNQTPGTVLVRHQASIVSATPADIRMLQRRYAAGSRRTRLEITPGTVEVETRPDMFAFIEKWRATTEQRLMGYLEQPVKPNAIYGPIRTSVQSLVSVVPDPRTPQEYADEVTRYLKVASSAIADRADRLLPRRRLTPIQLTARNLTDSTLAAVRLTMLFPGQAQLQLIDPDLPGPDFAALPVPPEPFGTPRTTTLSGLGAANAALLAARFQAQAAMMPPVRPMASFGPPRTRPARVEAIRVEDGVEIRFPPFELRSEETYRLPPILLDIFEAEGTSRQLSWTATSNNQPGTSSGTVQVNLTASPFGLDRLTSTSDADS